MNCTNCGAPVALVPGRGYFCCEHCWTLKFPEADAAENSQDRVSSLGQQADWDCPACSQPLEHATIEDARVDYCSECRGLLFDSETFAAVVRARRARSQEGMQAPQPIDPREFERSLRCPLCRTRMDVHPYYGPGAVVIDSCRHCQVVWLDHAELAAIESAPGRR